MNFRVAQFINEHEEDINNGDFFVVYTDAHSQLENHDVGELTIALVSVFDEDKILSSREAALRFILMHATDDMDLNYIYTYLLFKKKIMYNNTLGLGTDYMEEYLFQNANEFDIKCWFSGYGGALLIKKEE